MAPECPVDFVRMSAVRTAVLDGVVEEPARTRDLVERLEASESAVYEAIGDLAERGVIDAQDDVWEPTGVGAVVADLLDRQRHTVDVLQAAPEYWEGHDVSPLPREFRERLGALEGYEVVSGTDTDPGRALREVRARIEEADRIDGISAIYHEGMTATVRGADAEMRFVLARSLVEEVIANPPRDLAVRNAEVRIAPTEFSAMVTENCLLLSLPDAAGSPDIHTQLVSEDESAVQWGRDLFEAYWGEAVHPREVIEDPEDWPEE